MEIVKRPEFKSQVFNLVNGFAPLGFKCRAFMILSATGTVTITYTSGSKAVVPVGLGVNTQADSDGFELFGVSSTTANDAITIFWGDGLLDSFSPSGSPAIITIGDGFNPLTGVTVAAFPEVYTGGGWSRQRAPNVFKSASCTAAGATDIWIPTGGKSFRLLKYFIELSAQATQTSAGNLNVVLADGGPNTPFMHNFYVPNVAGAGTNTSVRTPLMDLGPLGYFSSGLGNHLSANLSVALTAGAFTVFAWGIEE